MAVPLLWLLVAGPSQRRTGFNPRWVRVRFVLNLNRLCPSNFVPPYQLVPIRSIPPLFHTIFIHMLFLPGGQTVDVCETLKMDRQVFSLFRLERVNQETKTRLYFWSEMVMIRIRLVGSLFCITVLSTAAGGIIGRCAVAMSSAERIANMR
jgi:hypothetical protein